MPPRILLVTTPLRRALNVPENGLSMKPNPRNADALDFKTAHGYIAEGAKQGLTPGVRAVAGR
jgi:hypothetical protein